MANGRPRGSSIFSGLLLIFIGVLLLLHNYRGFELGRVLLHYWPLLLIFWGALKLYERMAGSRTYDGSGSRITPGEVFLVLGLLALVGVVVAVEGVKEHFPDWARGDTTAIDLDVSPKPVPVNARITIRGIRGDISVRSSDEPEIRVNGKKNVRSWNQTDAQRVSERVGVEIVANGDGFEVQPTSGDSRVSVDMDVVVPSKAAVTIRNEKGDISVADMGTSVNINSGSGDIDVRNTNGDVND